MPLQPHVSGGWMKNHASSCWKRSLYSFANCGLPYYAGEIITDRSRLLVETPEAFRTRYRVDVRTGSEVTSVDPLSKTVTVKTSGGKAYTEKYDSLLLSPGARPMQPDIPGIRSSKIISLRSVPDADTLKSLADRGGRAAVIGGGFIGVETAENFIHRGLQVTLIQAAPHLLAPFDSDMIPIAEREMEQNGVRLLLHTQVDRITGSRSFPSASPEQRRFCGSRFCRIGRRYYS